MITCVRARPLWMACLGFCTNVLGGPAYYHCEMPVIFGVHQGQLMSEPERAFLRHLREQLQDEFSDSDWNVKVKCSQVDRNPLAVV